MDAIAALNTAIGKITTLPGWQIVGLLSAVGVITMAFMQVIKEVTPVRRWFQQWWIGKWIVEHAAIANAAGAVPPVVPATASKTLVNLATGGDERAFFELPAEQLVAQMNAAAQIALEYPKASAAFEELLWLLSAGVSASDVKAVIAGPPAASSPAQVFLDARNRVSHRIQRNLDGAQIALGSRWKFWMQIAAIVISILIFEAALLGTAGFNLGAFLISIPIGIVGGYIAPVTRDLVAAIEKLRKP